MKKLLLITAILLSGLYSFSQCSFSGWVQYPSGTFTPNPNVFTVVASCIYGGEYNLHNVVAGNTYEWSYCAADGGIVSWDTQLTLYNEANGNFLAYSDDACGYQSKITWTASFTGVVRLVTTEYYCYANSSCATLVSRQVGPPPSCNLVNPGTYVNETEPCGQDMNGGCNMLNPTYEPISCGTTVFGTSHNNGVTRDTDWYQFSLNQTTTVTATLQAEFQAALYFVNTNNCVGPSILYNVTSPACSTTTLSATMNPGTWVIFVAPEFASMAVCGATSEYILSLDIGMSAAAITPVNTLCSNGSPVALSAVPSGGTFSGPGVIGNNFDPALAGPGTHTLTYTKNSPCAATGTIQITVNAAPNTTINPAGPFCSTDPVATLTSVTPGGTWSGTGITNPVTGSFDPAQALIGTNTISYTHTANGCSNTSTATVTVNQTPSANITPAGPFCTSNNPATLQASTPGGTWSGTGITNPSAGIFDPAVAGVGSHTISYGVTTNGCSASGSIVIVVNQSANSTINGSGPYCVNGSGVNLTSVTPGGTWSGPGITNPSTGAFDPSVAGTGTHTITYTISGTCGSSSTTSVLVNAAPDATINAAGPFCLATPASNLSSITPGGTWSGTGITNPSAGTFNPATAGVGTHTITYTVTVNGCSSTSTTTVTVNQNQSSTITPVGPFCPGDPVITLTGANPGGTWSGPGITNPNTGTFSPSVAGPGTHTITYTISGACGSSSTQTIVVNNAANASFAPAGPFCSADPALNLTPVTPGGTWSGTGITNSTQGTFDPAIAGVGSHVVTYTILGACGASSSQTIIVNATPNATFTMPLNLCEGGTSVTPVPVVPGGTFSGNGVSNGVFNPSVSGTGSFVVTYNITSNGCTSSSSQTVVVNPIPVASFTSSGPPNPVVNFNNTSTNGNSYLWNFGDGQTSNQQNPVHTYQGTGTYTVTLIVTNGCGSDTATRVIDINFAGLTPENNAAITVFLFPNPATEQVKIDLYGLSGDYTLDILDITGRIMYQGLFQANNPVSEVLVNISEFPSANYLLRIGYKGQIITRKFIKI